MTPEARAALIAAVAAACIESMQRDAEPPRRSHARKRRMVHCGKCGATKWSCIFVRVCRRCGGLMVIDEEQQK